MPLNKNKMNPLIIAMKVGDPGNANVRPELAAPRMLRLTAEELGGNPRPGDPVTTYIYGTVKSQGKDGLFDVSITHAEPEKEEAAPQESASPPMVMTQESHVP